MAENIAVIDLWTDANRGDCALQLGLIKMLKQKYPDAGIHGIFRFGYNEISSALPETAYTRDELDFVYFAPRPTLYAGLNTKRNFWVRKLHSLLSFVIVIFYFLLHSFHLNFLLPVEVKRTFLILEEADVVYWKGKNFRDYPGFMGIQRQLTLLFAGYLTRLLCKKVQLVNASVWSINNVFQKNMIKAAMAHCERITVRDKSSQVNLKQLGLESEYSRDLSFFEIYSHLPLESVEKEFSIVLTVTKWGNEIQRKNYRSYLASIINHKLATSELYVAISPQVVREAENNNDEIEELLELIDDRNRVVVKTEVNDIRSLMKLYASSQFLVGTRMHSCVFAASVGTPFLAIAYDSGPKWEVLYDFIECSSIKKMSELIPSSAIDDLNNCKLKPFDMSNLSKLSQENV